MLRGRRLLRQSQSAATRLAQLSDALARYFASGEWDCGIALDYEGIPEWRRRVYETLRRVPPGKTISYGALADAAGMPGSARAVGAAMRMNRHLILVPCHRVVAADGSLCGFSAGIETKRALLALEGVPLNNDRVPFDFMIRLDGRTK